MIEKVQEFVTYLTFRCNYSCKMCTQDGIPQMKELSGKEWDKIFSDIEQRYPNSSLVFLGGEPTLHKDFAEIIERASCHNLHKHVVTNAFYIEKYLKLLKNNMCGLTVSVDGIGETHDKIRNHKGAYAKIEEVLEKINEINKNLLPGEKPLWFNINFVLLPDNINEVVEFIKIIKKFEPNKIVLSHPRHICHENNIKMQKIVSDIYGQKCIKRLEMRNDIVFENEYVKKLNETVIYIKKTFDPAIVREHPDFSEEERLNYYDDNLFASIRAEEKCLSPYTIPFIYPDGTVASCLYNTLGNALSERIDKIWNNIDAINTRKYLDKNKHFPVCTRCTCFYKPDEF